MLSLIAQSLKQYFDHKLVDELLGAYAETRNNFYLGGLRLSEVEGGRFCEAAFRMLQQYTTRSFTPLGKPLDTEKLIVQLANLSSGLFPDAIRLHIPRTLRLIYDIRNKRDAAHLADGIDPNLQDATLVMASIDWVLAEFLRLYHSVTPQEMQSIIERLVERKAPAIQDFNGFLKVLKTSLSASDYVLLVLYERGNSGAVFSDLEKWVRPQMRANLRRTLRRLVDERAFVHVEQGTYVITRSGIAEVEKRRLHETDLRV